MLEMKNVSKVYNKGSKTECTALNNISFVIEDNEYVTIMGKSGSGKTTILNLLSLQDYPSTGEIIINGKNSDNMKDHERAFLRRKEIGIIVQDFSLINYFSMLDNILLPLTLEKINNIDKITKAFALIEQLDLKDIPLKKAVKNLSGGQKQRVAIARALINDPKVILADEPTGSIDEQTSEEIMKIFKSLHNDGKTIILITHDSDLAKQSDRIIELNKGEIIQDKNAAEKVF